MKKLLALLVAALLIVCASLALAEPVAIKALILPKFESGEMAGDFPGEAQYYYEGYCEGGESYDIVGCPNPLYVKDGVALCVTGMGKVNSAMTLQAILMDDRFDFSNAYIISTGCAGSAIEYGVMGDVFVITATVDFDLGHHADARDLTTDLATTWFHDESYDDASAKLLNQELCEKVFNLVKDVQIETTEKTRAFMAATFDNADWAIRDPKVLRGTTVTADNYWKGMHDHENALLMTETTAALIRMPSPRWRITRWPSCSTASACSTATSYPRFRQHRRVYERRPRASGIRTSWIPSRPSPALNPPTSSPLR
ncbi:MAG: hypothetical protein ACLS6G_00245 [Christensenellales bacterium]